MAIKVDGTIVIDNSRNLTNLGSAITVAQGGTGASDATTARSNLGLAIGSNVQAYNATLAAVAGGTYTGTTSITTLGTIGAGVWQGTAVAVTYGGTGATDAATARTNLGLVIGTNVQAYDADLSAIAGLAGTNGFLKKTAADTWSLDTNTYITGNQTITLSGDATGSGTTAITVTLATVGASKGGTGQTSYAVGDILYASAATTLSKLTAVATGSALISGGVTTAPSWGKIGLTTHVSGTLAVGNGGTGVTTLTGILKGNGASAFTAATAGTDYLAPPSGTAILKANSGGALANATANTDYVSPIGADGLLTRWMFQDTGWDYFDQADTNSSGTATLDYTNGSVQRWAPTGTRTLATSNWPPSGALGELLIEGVNLGAATITWPTINWIKNDGSTTTTFSSNGITLRSSGTDWVFLWTRDAGTTIYGRITR